MGKRRRERGEKHFSFPFSLKGKRKEKWVEVKGECAA